MTTDLKPYPKMKDSGVPWLGEVPEHWKVLPNRAVFSEINEREHPDEQMLSVTITKGVVPQQALLEDSSKKDSSRLDKSAYKLVRPGDIAYNKMRAWQGAIGVSEYQGIVSPAYVIQRPRTGNNARYLHYLLRTPAFAKEAERWSYGITSDMWSLRPEHFKMIYTCIPPAEEQAAIVRYLDGVDRKIRRFIRNRRRLIEVLNEHKQAIINQVVTGKVEVKKVEGKREKEKEKVEGKREKGEVKGEAGEERFCLVPRPAQLMKPSGVDWLGDIPKEWEVRRLKSVAGIRYGLGQPPRESETGLPLIRATNVDYGKIIEENLVYVDPEDVPKSRDAFLSEGEIIVVRSGAYTADSAIVTANYAGAVAGYDMVVTPVCINAQFLAFVLLSRYVRNDQLIISSMRSAQPHLNAEELGAAFILMPTEIEQGIIVKKLHNFLATTAQVENRVQREIDLIREYRTRLIADVVTGKVDVRKVEVRSEKVEEEEEREKVEGRREKEEEEEMEEVLEEVKGLAEEGAAAEEEVEEEER